MPKGLALLLTAALLTLPAAQALAQEAAAAAADRFSVRAVPPAQSAPVAYEAVQGIFFRATIAGREVWAALDTGATSSLIDIGLARAAGLTTKTTDAKINTPRGQMEAWRADDVSILIPGQFETRYPQLAAVDLAAVSGLLGRKVEFVLGQDFLRSLAVIVDPVNHNFYFAPTGAFRAPPGAQLLKLAPGQPLTRLTIEGQSVLVAIDTGFNGQLNLDPMAFARFVPQDDQAGEILIVGADGAGHMTRIGTVKEVVLGAITLSDVRVQEGGARSEGVLGFGVLSKFRFAMDLTAGKFWLAPAG